MTKWAVNYTKQKGFTIVELLIVVVVIAILAAITIVAYNGIQNRAKDSAAQAAATQTARKLAIYYTTHGDTYPPSLTDSELGLPNASGSSSPYQYTVSADGKTYCATTTTNGASYFNSNATQSTTKGACDGHGLNGATAITNYHMNPQFSGSNAPTNQTGTSTTITTFSGSLMAQATTTTSAAASMRLQPNTQRWSISAGQSTFALVKVCNGTATARDFSITIRYYDLSATNSSLGTELDTSGSGGQTINSGACANFSAAGTAPTGTLSAGINVNRNSGNGAASGDVYYADNVFFSDRAAGFADGSTTGWVWNGTANNATSTGSPQ